MFRAVVNKVFGNKIKKVPSEELLAKINLERLPKHIAVIMDGNGRWASRRGLPRPAGHRAGVESLRDIVRASTALGIKHLTVYAFSTENWKRPEEEINVLMSLLVEYLRKEIEELHENKVVIKAIGRIDGLPEVAQKELFRAQEKTKNNVGLVLNLALNYGGRTEILDAVNNLMRDNKSQPITEAVMSEYLYTCGQPDVDLLIRPSGELRISNFLLWQSAYAEFWFTNCLWPDFRRQYLYEAIVSYQKRDRRYGGLNS